jgi:hypothetical protein
MTVRASAPSSAFKNEAYADTIEGRTECMTDRNVSIEPLQSKRGNRYREGRAAVSDLSVMTWHAFAHTPSIARVPDTTRRLSGVGPARLAFL